MLLFLYNIYVLFFSPSFLAFAMCSIPGAFDSLRCAYRGATDSINDLDVDPYGGCAYAASCSGDVLVWDVVTLQLKAQLRHVQWVNAVRCFPLANSAAASSSLMSNAAAVDVPSLRAYESTSSPAAAAVVSPTTANSTTLDSFADVRSRRPEIRWVITGCEDGMVCVWSPMTYRTQRTCQPTRNAITALHLVPYTKNHSKNSANTSPTADAAAQTRDADTPGLTDDAAFLCAASLQHIYVMQVNSATPELVLLRSLQHTVLITAVTPVCTSASLSSPLLAVGQEDGTLCLWNCVGWFYEDTLPYPAGESDVDADARLSPGTLHEPQWEHGMVLGTFAYNQRRCNRATNGDVATAAAAFVNASAYQREMPGAVPADAATLVERLGSPLPPALQRVLQLAGPSRQNAGRQDPIPLATVLRYDARRVTCLTSNTSLSSGTPNTHLYTGHATGEVLMWGYLRQAVPLLLLKKIILFPPGTWVWHLCALRPLVTSTCTIATTKGGKAANAKPKVLRGKAALNAKFNASAASPTGGLSTLYNSTLELIVWSDSGAVQYVSSHNKQLTHQEGPGFMASAATSWISEALTEEAHSTTASQDTKAAIASPKAVVDAAVSSSVVAHQYVLMGNFEGRVERYDISQLMRLVKSLGKVH